MPVKSAILRCVMVWPPYALKVRVTARAAFSQGNIRSLASAVCALRGHVARHAPCADTGAPEPVDSLKPTTGALQCARPLGLPVTHRYSEGFRLSQPLASLRKWRSRTFSTVHSTDKPSAVKPSKPTNMRPTISVMPY